ncbi:glycerophosphodiester phosphodiesterase [Anaeromyxobacter terrae]|uniref:glycerophosphodiester phosphodiesterase n=1 Tax=Anaeromyxobacter terrae TaxID=2925406 RepID=UPI001F587853|nr:glycerophosphodiester phosphodiesterase family protein [Anaeromyxobacter sp. SG22]
MIALARFSPLLPLASLLWIVSATGCGRPELAPILGRIREPPSEPPALPPLVGTEPPPAVLDWNEAAFPVIIGHRGSGNIRAPENTYAAFDHAAGLGAPIETDVLESLDGEYVISHDDTTDRMCGTTGQRRIDQMTLDELLALDCAQGYRPEVFSPQRMPRFEDFLQRYGSSNLLLPELKPTTRTDAGTVAASLIVQHGLQRSALAYSFSAAYLAEMRAVDPTIPRVLICGCEISASQVLSDGLWGVAVSRPYATKEYIDGIHATGARVFVWTVNDVTSAEPLVASGADGIITDDPGYLRAFTNARTPKGTTTVSPPASLLASTWRWHTSSTGLGPPIVADDHFVTWAATSPPDPGTFFRIDPGIRTADVPAAQTIQTTLKVTKVNTDLTRHFGIRFAWATDNDGDWFGNGTPNARQGYHFAYRLNGAVELVRDDGTRAGYVILSRQQCTPVAESDTVPLRLDVTEGTLTVTRTDTGCSVTAADATYPRGGFVDVYGSGVVPGVGTTTVLY